MHAVVLACSIISMPVHRGEHVPYTWIHGGGGVDYGARFKLKYLGKLKIMFKMAQRHQSGSQMRSLGEKNIGVMFLLSHLDVNGSF